MPDLTDDPPAPAPDGLPVLAFADAAALDAWLDEHGASSRGVWLRLSDDAGTPSVRTAEAVEALLRSGWTTGLRGPDAPPWGRLRAEPRRPSAPWSQADVAAVRRLQAQGRMRPEGLREVERAQEDGRWDRAYPAPSTTQVPDDLRAALDAEPAAAAAFAGLDDRNRAAVLHAVTSAKRAAVRARRVAEAVAMLGEGRTPYPPRG